MKSRLVTSMFAVTFLLLAQQTALAVSYGLGFSQDGQSVVVPNSSWVDVTGPLTVEAWVKPDAGILARGMDFIVSKQMGGTGYMLDTNYNTPDWSPGAPHGFGFETAGAQTGGAMQVQIGPWTHVAGVWGEGKRRLYVNGQLDSESTALTAPTSNPLELWLGSSPFGGDTNWRGTIDEVRIWGIARTQAEIQSTMNRYLTGQENGLRAYWTFDEGQGQIAGDYSGHGNTATLGSPGPSWVAGKDLVPEPSTFILLGAGALTLLLYAWRRWKPGDPKEAFMKWFMVTFAGVVALSWGGGPVEAETVLWPGNGHYYERVDDFGHTLYWDQARDQAASRSYQGLLGHLATITSQPEQEFITNTLLGPPAQDYYWIGGWTQDYVHWGWITGETWAYTNWAAGKPNNFYGDEHALYAYAQYLQGYPPGVWDDYSVSRVGAPFLVEYEGVPEPCTLTLLGVGVISLLAYAWRRWRRVG